MLFGERKDTRIVTKQTINELIIALHKVWSSEEDAPPISGGLNTYFADHIFRERYIRQFHNYALNAERFFETVFMGMQNDVGRKNWKKFLICRDSAERYVSLLKKEESEKLMGMTKERYRLAAIFASQISNPGWHMYAFLSQALENYVPLLSKFDEECPSEPENTESDFLNFEQFVLAQLRP